MSDTACSTRFCLRDLPLPAKVVITCFLLAVGLGYSAALVQMHFQDSKSGEAMPTIADIVLKFTGKKKVEGVPPPPVSTFVRLITAPEEASFGGSGTMAPAFFSKSPDFIEAVRGADHTREQLRAQRTGERDALVLWATAEPADREKAYRDDHFGIPADTMPKSITKQFLSDDGTAVKVKSIIDTRCVRCHRESGADKDAAGATSYPLDTYEGIAKFLEVKEAPAVGSWVKVQEPMSLTRLTQSTHAHLLSFAMLFSLTGLAFAFTSYRTSIRCAIAPLALIAIVTDVAFWWLARLSDNYGMYFAMAVVGTGGVAGMALGAQIVLSLWNMYGPKGKTVIALLLLLGGAVGTLVFTQVMMPGMEENRKSPTKPANGGNGTGNGAPTVAMSRMERVLQLPGGSDRASVMAIPFKTEPDFNMVRAMFDMDGKDEFALAKKEKDEAAMDMLMPERHGERLGLIAWIKSPDAERKATYEADAFPLPPDAKQTTKHYVADGKLKIQSLITDRCVRCHGDEEKAKFDNYESMKPFLEP